MSQKRPRSVLITGATGIMGSWVLGESLKRGYAPIVLMRDAGAARARERLLAVLGLLDCTAMIDKVRVVHGDTRLPDLGLSSTEVAELRSTLGAMIHCAACTSFSPRQDAELWATNVGGVANVLHFLAGSNIPLYHVSTAFVAGKRQGQALETELDLNQDFNNTYERSKCESELLVQKAISKGSLKASIFRPGIIVGSTECGQIGQFLNFYGFLRFLDVVSSGRYNGKYRHLRVKANPEATKNLVPVDWIAKAFWHIVEADGPCGKTYHLTNPNPVTQKDLLNWANDYLGPNQVRLKFVDRLDNDVNPLEQAVNATFRLYRAYLEKEPQFDMTNTNRALNGALPFQEIGPKFYETLLSYAREHNWQGVYGCKVKTSNLGEESSSEEKLPESLLVDSDVHDPVRV